jgi:predicted NBD/HSP70 family sugar kinase
MMLDKNFRLIEPQFVPPLEDAFRPAVLANRAFEAEVAGEAVPLVLGLERLGGKLTHYDITVYPQGHPRAHASLRYVERIVKFLLWQRGGYKLYAGGPAYIGEYLRECYSPEGERQFDSRFMGELVYEQPFTVLTCSPEEVPPEYEAGRPSGGYLDGCRIGFDLGASDRKVSAVVNGQVVYSEEVIWEPRVHSDPEYHYHEIITALKTAAARLPHVDAIGGSSAGIYIDNRPMVASLFRGIPQEQYPQIKNLFLRIQEEMNVPLEVINDGDVTALAGAMSLEDNGVLGLAMGSSQAAGYVDTKGHILGWLNELAFAPIDYSPSAPVDEWSGDTGCGSMYFSQMCVFRLAPRAGIHIPVDIPDAEKLEFVQDKLEAGHAGATSIWESMGIYLGYALAHYADFYKIKHVLLLGRCTSGKGGTLLLEGATAVLRNEFPELAARMKVQLPDENSRRVGQAIAAASLPALKLKE